MHDDIYFSWGWAPHYVLANRWGAPDGEYERVASQRAASILGDLVRAEPNALRSIWMSTNLIEPDQLEALSLEALRQRLVEDLERPTGRFALYERNIQSSRGTLDDSLADEIVDLIELAAQTPTTTWIEFRLHDQSGEGFPGLEAVLTYPDGREIEGRLSDLSLVHVADIDPGNYTIRFPAAELVVLGEDGPDVAPLADYGVTRLELVGEGGARSTGWTANDEPPGPDDPPDFWLAPEVETVKISYTIEDPEGRTQRATLELVVHDDDGDEIVLWTRELSEPERTAGDHELDWDGAVDAEGEALPGGFVDVQHSPYTLRLRLRGHGEADPPVASTRLAVEVATIELELGDAAVLSRQLDRTLHAAIGGSLPAPGASAELRLVSNVFKTNSAEMNDNSLFHEYEALWGPGPNIPVFATVKVKGSGGTPQLAPRALADLPIAWEWIDAVEDTSSLHAKAKAFLDHALDFDRDLTEPTGDNCHVDRGGKRGPDAGEVFPPQRGQAPADALTEGTFPFRVEPYVERRSLCKSWAWTEGVAAGKTGVLLSPSRMAGDALSVRVYRFRDAGEDGPDDAAVKAESGVFRVLREVHVVKYLKKNASIGDVNIGTFQAYYEAASVKMDDRSGGSQTMAEADYNQKIGDAVAGLPWHAQAAVDGTVNQYTAGDYALHFRAYADYKNAVKADRGWNDAQLNTWLAAGGSSVSTSSRYHGILKSWAKTITVAACDGYVHADAGINILQFSGLYNLETSPGGRRLNGFAPSFSSTGRDKCAFVLCPGPSNYGSGHNNAQQTLTHEIGHHMFLPHAPFPSKSPPAGSQAAHHDETHHNCTMGYDYSAERKFCGLCILRMRGWSANWLFPKPSQNARP